MISIKISIWTLVGAAPLALVISNGYFNNWEEFAILFTLGFAFSSILMIEEKINKILDFLRIKD